MPHISWIAVIVSTLVAFILGGLWYGPLFSKPWMREMGVGRDFKPRVSQPILFGLAIAFNFISALVFAAFVGPSPSLALALGAGAAIGLAWVAPCMVIVYLFAARSTTLAAIDAGYAVAQFVAFGVVFFALG
ncbi:MAG: DUF1761 domain-containing protein [Rudaea sp.]